MASVTLLSIVLLAYLVVFGTALPLEVIVDVEQTIMGPALGGTDSFIEKVCGGFAIQLIDNPSLYRGAYVLPSREFQLQWERGDSQVFEFSNLELLQEGIGLVSEVWVGEKQFDETGKYTMTLKLNIDERQINDQSYVFRGWGNNKVGGHCTAYSYPVFLIPNED